MNSTLLKKTLAPENGKGAVWLACPFQLVSLLDMIKFYGDKFYCLAYGAELLRNDAAASATSGLEEIPAEAKAKYCEKFLILRKDCEELGLTFSACQIERVLVYLTGGEPAPDTVTRDLIIHARDKKSYTFERLASDMTILHLRITDEVSTKFLLQISPNRADYFSQPTLFGQQVADNFPSASLDIEEAGKCFAVGRYTACVFHLLRVVEVGVKAFGTGLGVMANITTAQPSWGDVLRETWKEIQAKNKSGDPTWTHDKKSFYENAQSDLQIVKTAWRNPTMHVENTYDEERAEDIFNAVKGWMRHLAKHLDESGKFTP